MKNKIITVSLLLVVLFARMYTEPNKDNKEIHNKAESKILSEEEYIKLSSETLDTSFLELVSLYEEYPQLKEMSIEDININLKRMPCILPKK